MNKPTGNIIPRRYIRNCYYEAYRGFSSHCGLADYKLFSPTNQLTEIETVFLSAYHFLFSKFHTPPPLNVPKNEEALTFLGRYETHKSFDGW